MLSRPKLPDDEIAATLHAAWGLAPSALDFLPVGNDARAWSYRAETPAQRCFVKLRRGTPNPAALHIPRHLHSLGVQAAVAPLPTQSGSLFAPVNDEFSLIVYPYIAGESAWETPLTPAQWRDWGRIMRAIHDAPISSQLAQQTQREVYGIKWLDAIGKIERHIEIGDYRHAIAKSLAAVWRENAEDIALCKLRYSALGWQLEMLSPPLRICHADIHRANLILGAEGGIHIVDWDDALLAPPERDLMFFLGDGHAPDEEAAFLTGYGHIKVNAAALAYYRYDWTLQEFADYGERVFLDENLPDEELALALREFERLFAPGDVVKRAHAAFASVSA